MAYLVRKINVNRWPDGANISLDGFEVQADAITNDLRTDNNEISWWRVDDLSQIEMVGVSFVSTLKEKANGVFRFVAIPFDEVNEKLSIKNTPEHGITAIKAMKNEHYDIFGLNYKSLGVLADIVANSTADKSMRFIKTLKVKDAISKLKQLKQQNELDVACLGFVKDKLE